MKFFVFVNCLSKFFSTFEKIHNANAGGDHDSDSDEMSNATKQYKPKQKDGTEKHKKVLAEYVASVKQKCTSIIRNQSSSLQTGYSFCHSIEY